MVYAISNAKLEKLKANILSLLVIRLLFSIICLLSSVICLLSSVICHLSSVFCQYFIYYLLRHPDSCALLTPAIDEPSANQGSQ